MNGSKLSLFDKGGIGSNAANTVKNTAWQKEEFPQAIQVMRPTLLRYPSGTVANYWDWKTGWAIPPNPPCTESCSFDPNKGVVVSYPSGKVNGYVLSMNFDQNPPIPFLLSDFAEWIAATGAVPIFVLNVVTQFAGETDPIDYQLQLLREARDVYGLPVRYIELGNEVYLPGDKDKFGVANELNRMKWPDDETAGASKYATEMAEWIRRIGLEFPEAKIALVVTATRDKEDQIWTVKRELNWTRNLLDTLATLDYRPQAVAYHPYSWAGPQGAVTSASAVDANLLFSQIYKRMRSINIDNSGNVLVPPEYEIWYTEFNLSEIDVPLHGTWMHGLVAGLQALLNCESEQVTMSINYQLFGSAVFSAVFNNTNGFKFGGNQFIPPPTDENGNLPPTEAFGLTATGVTIKAIAEAVTGMKFGIPLKFEANNGTPPPLLTSSLNPAGYPGLYGWKFWVPTDQGVVNKAAILNLTATAQSLSVKKSVIGTEQPRYTLYSAPRDRYIGSIADVQVSSGTLAGSLSLPAYALVILEQ